jgi:mono/diheme cytochrome c family protein
VKYRSNLWKAREVFVQRDWRLLPWVTTSWVTASWVTILAPTILVSLAGAQGNIDAGRTPAQLFADTCAACHRSTRDIRRPTAGFLRQHYTAGSDEAAAIANYLNSGAASDPRAGQPKRPPAAVADPGLENAKQQPKQLPKQAASPPAIIDQAKDQAKSAQGQPKGRRPAATAEVRPGGLGPDERAPESAILQSLLSAGTPPGSPPVILEPFEE